MKNKSGMSGMVVAIIMIAMVLLAGAIVWGVVNKLITGEIDKSSSCFGIFDKVSIGKRYTCFDSVNNVMRVQLSIGDIDVDGVLVSISGNTKQKSFTITNDLKEIDTDLQYYSGGTNIKLPSKNGGITYNYTWGEDDAPNLIRIAPIINNKQCEISDTLSGIDDCSLLI